MTTTLVLDLLRADRIDSVFHLAAQPIVGDANASPLPTFETNIQGTWVLARGLPRGRRREGRRRLLGQGVRPPRRLPYTEDSALQPIFPYDVSKAATDLIARSYWHTYGLPVAVTRFANLYGGGDRNFSRLIPETVTAVLDGRRPVIRSDGSPERDFLYVEDAAGAYLAIAEALADGRGRRRGLQRRLGPAASGPRGGRPDLRARARRRRARLPGDREPERGDRPAVPRLDQDPRADRLGAAGRPARGPQPDARVVRRSSGGEARPFAGPIRLSANSTARPRGRNGRRIPAVLPPNPG